MIAEELQDIIDEADMKMDDAIQFLKKEFSHIRAGKANPALISSVNVSYYGAQTPLQQLANISAPEPRMLMVQPYDKSVMTDIEKAIMASGLGLNPMNDGELIRIPLPILTEERRKELAKMAKAESETAKVSIRNARKDANNEMKKSKVSEDEQKNYEIDIQKHTDTVIQKTDDVFARKEKEILTV